MPTQTRYVTIELPGQDDAVPAGMLTMDEVGAETRRSTFSYGKRYVERSNALAVDPLSLPLPSTRTTGLVPAGGLTLFGALRDASPDYWGRRVIENKLHAAPDSLPESTFLDHAGFNRIGALNVQLERTGTPHVGSLPKQVQLEYLLEAAGRVEEGLPVPSQLEYFFIGAPSLGGARPKALVEDDGHQWIAKFPARGDRMDMSWIEYGTLKLAERAGLRVPPLRLVELPDDRNIMLVQRFDRIPKQEGFSKIHMVSALTMLGIHESESHQAHYADIARVIEQYGAVGSVGADRLELFKRMVFNILVSNDDDHLRNHAFLYSNRQNGWRLSPLYDVVPRNSNSSERFLHLSIGPHGRLSTLENALSGAGQFGLTAREAAHAIDEVASVTRGWVGHFEDFNVPGKQIDLIKSAFRRPSDIGIAAVEKAL
jgi:serine/threonine-protein kinase HipA